MDLDKSLYMKEFMNIRNEYGSVTNQIAQHPLFVNLYDELIPKQETKEVKQVIEEIEEKTIHLLKKGTGPNIEGEELFPELPDISLQEEEKVGTELPDISLQEEEKVGTEEQIGGEQIGGEHCDDPVKVVQIGGDEDPIMSGGYSELKTISINPNYQVKES